MTSTKIVSLKDKTDSTSGSPFMALTACRLYIFRHHSLLCGNAAPLSLTCHCVRSYSTSYPHGLYAYTSMLVFSIRKVYY